MRKCDDRSPHTYINADGKEVPSVTHTLAILKKKQTLVWANFLGFKRISVEKFINHKAMIGSLLHHKIECFFSGDKYIPHPSLGVEDEVNHLFKNFMAWYEEAKPKAIFQEKQIVGKNYGGTIDLLCNMFDNKIVLLDFKTSKTIHATQFMQLGGYLTLFKEVMPEIYKQIDLCMIVSITPAKVQTVVKSKKEMKKYMDAFTNNYILYDCYNEILTNEWNDSLKDVSIL